LRRSATAQKEFTHNEALATLDVLVGGAVEALPTPDAPLLPAVGTAFIVGDAPTGAWTGKPQCIASYTDGGWRFIDPVEGMAVYVKATGTMAVFRTGAWDVGGVRASQLIVNGQQVVGTRKPGIASAAGGSTVDVEARAAIEAILDVLRGHGLIAA